MVVVSDSESLRVEQQSDAQTLAEAMDVLRQMFGEEIPTATDIIVPRWHTNPYFKGSYSAWAFGATASDYKLIKVPF